MKLKHFRLLQLLFSERNRPTRGAAQSLVREDPVEAEGGRGNGEFPQQQRACFRWKPLEFCFKAVEIAFNSSLIQFKTHLVAV